MISKQYLIRNWVQYMKNNNIVSSSVSQGGQLSYRRRPTKTDLFKYLSYITPLTDGEIIRIIAQARRQERADREYTKPRDLGIDIWNRPAGINEDTNIRDTGQVPVSNDVINYAFDLVVEHKKEPAASDSAKVESVMKLIRESMLPNQRQYLWELLTNAK